MLQLNKSFLQEVTDPLLNEKEVKLFVKRDDLIHPYVSGNKWRKLKYNIEAFLQSGKEYILTFGGAFSNHIVATAAAGREYGIKTIGVIRGEELKNDSNAVLRFAKECGMELLFISREKYKTLHYSEGIESFINSKLKTSNSKLYILPEGGLNELAVKGCEEIVDEIEIPFNYICCACGTGATLSGMIRKLKPNQQAIGFSVLRGEDFLEKEIRKFTGDNTNWSVKFDYHFGGYAKANKQLNAFCKEFSEKNNVLIEPVYTGKMFFGIYDLLKKDFFKQGSAIVAVHTGGMAFSRQIDN
jgi:1-aminocyclopropane-1-carboxylate deaminase